MYLWIVMCQYFFVDRTQNRNNCFGSFLAEDGWPDSQVDLAKQLLNENCGKAIALKYYSLVPIVYYLILYLYSVVIF